MGEPVGAGLQTVAGPSKLVEAIESGCCPICCLLHQDEFDTLCRWVGGNIADKDNRRRLDEAGRFCNHHFWLLKEIHSPQSGSLMNNYLATKLTRWLRDSARQDWQAQTAWLRGAATRCPLCAHLWICESTHVRSLVEWLNYEAAWPQYAESRGLCLPHLLRCQALIQDKSLRERRNQTQAAQIERLQQEMQGLARKLAAGRRWEVSRDEWSAWRRAIEKFTGRRGVSPPC